MGNRRYISANPRTSPSTMVTEKESKGRTNSNVAPRSLNLGRDQPKSFCEVFSTRCVQNHHQSSTKVKLKNVPDESRRASDSSFSSSRSRELRLFGNVSVPPKSKTKSIKSTPPNSVSSGITVLEDCSVMRRNGARDQTKNRSKPKKSRRKKYPLTDENKDVAVLKKTIITLRSSDNRRTGHSSDKLTVCSEPWRQQQAPEAVDNAKNNSALPLKHEDIMAAQRSVSWSKEARKHNIVPSNRIETGSLPKIEERIESESSRSYDSNSFSLTQSSTSGFSESSVKQNPILSVVKINFQNLRIRRRARLTIKKTEDSVYPKSCLKKGTSSKKTGKKCVSFALVDDDEGSSKLVPKRSARLEKCPPFSLSKVPPSNRNHRITQYVTAPVVVSIQKTYSHNMVKPREDQGIDSIMQGPNACEGLCGQIGIFHNISPYGPGMYTSFSHQISSLGPPAVTITELEANEQAHGSPVTTVGTYGYSNRRSHDEDRGTITRAIGDFLETAMNNKVGNIYLISEEGILKGSSNESAKCFKPKQSLEERRKLIRLKLKDNVTPNRSEENMINGNVANEHHEKMSKKVTKERLHATRGSKYKKKLVASDTISLNISQGVLNSDGTVATQECSTPRHKTSPNEVIDPVSGRPVPRGARARSNVIKNFQRSSNQFDAELQEPPGTNSTSEMAQGSVFVSLGSSGESRQKASPRRRRLSLSPNRYLSGEAHQTLPSRRAVRTQSDITANTTKPLGQPRTPLTMEMTGKPDPKTTSTVSYRLDSEIPEINETVLELVREKPLAYFNEKLSQLITKKLAGHPLQNKTLADFKRERQMHYRNIMANGAPAKKNVTLPSKNIRR